MKRLGFVPVIVLGMFFILFAVACSGGITEGYVCEKYREISGGSTARGTIELPIEDRVTLHFLAEAVGVTHTTRTTNGITYHDLTGADLTHAFVVKITSQKDCRGGESNTIYVDLSTVNRLKIGEFVSFN